MVFGWLGRAVSSVIHGTTEAVITGVSAIGNAAGSLVGTVRDGFEDITHREEIHENERQAQVADVRTNFQQQRTRMTEAHGRTARDINDGHEIDVNEQANNIRERTQVTIESTQNFTTQMYQITANSVTTMTNTQTTLMLQNRSSPAVEN